MSGERIYHHPTQLNIQIPQLDILTLLFDSEYSASVDNTILHVEAANPNNKISKQTLREVLQQIAYGLRNQYGVGSNEASRDVVTVITHGQILVPALLYGIIAAGGCYSAASPSSTLDELKHQIIIGTSKLIVCGTEHKDLAVKAASACGIPTRNVLVLDSSAGNWSLRSADGTINALSDQKLDWRRITDPEALKKSLIVVLWSSGTTGLPKGVMLSHLNLVAETFVVFHSLHVWVAGEKAKGTYEAGPPPMTLAHLPVSHIAGLFGYMIAPIYLAGTVVWMKRYIWRDFIKYAKQYPITSLYTVPSIWLRVSKSADITDHFKSLNSVSTGAAPMDGKLMKAVNSRVGDGTAKLIGQTWGLSETTGAVTAMPKDVFDDTGSIGEILPSVEIRLVDENYNDVDPDNQEGELLVRGPLVTNGYFNNPQATKDSFHGPWFCSGDIGIRRNGKFYVIDRKKELLKYKGLQVAPAEIENVLFEHAQIREAAVIGVPAQDDPGTDLPRAYIVTVDNARISEEDVKGWVNDRLAHYKQLRGGVVFVDQIPKNAIGKFLRRELRERAKKEMRTASKL